MRTVSEATRQPKSRLFPWYDSGWLSRYEQAKSVIRSVRPEALPGFVNAFKVLHTREDFEVTRLDRPFDDNALAEIRQVVASLRPTELELYEARSFGRFIVHDHQFFSELQQQLVPLITEVVGEPVDCGYNFLSLYSNMGVCPVHMDSPEAKWTFDLCIDQSAPWPIHFSQVCPWPEPETEVEPSEDWQEAIRNSDALRFTTHTLHPGEAVVFSGSSQWHYRDAMPATDRRSFCNLLFLHYVPKGTKDLIDPSQWARRFDIPELITVVE